ncbi:MAG: hypothetical protein CL575_10580 [Altererythrobacter sp.]|nr:hypothetical protein [Altererythrobacter sp.]
MNSRALTVAVSIALLSGCSSQDGEPRQDQKSVKQTAESSEVSVATDTPANQERSDDTLRLEGLADLKIGEPVPVGSSFAQRGAQIPNSDCRTISSPDYDGVYGLTEGKELGRITVGSDSRFKLQEGIAVGSSEAEVNKLFPGFVSSPHAYIEAPAKYLTQPGGDPRLRFEIDRNAKVSAIHVGLMPQLEYVEGCA